MASDLSLKLSKPIQVSDLKSKSKEFLEAILNCRIGSNLLFPYSERGIPIGYTGVVIASVEGYELDIVELTFINVPSVEGFEDPDEEGWWVSATVRSSQDSPLKLALAAALICAINENEKATIIDESQVWVSSREIQPDMFLRLIQNQSTYSSLESALEGFAKRLKLQYEGGRD